ncbi:C1 family peptidase [Sphingoaurantiacus capsulatus]|uniref:C1 family peptidase n=1 Tax=Sphingoaurantiacus capsulatus TaxID=1771310 RepID=A0ABV7XF12_9SPHN
MIEIDTDLRPMLGPVRDQGARPTCLAFAASDAHAALRDGWSPLSCEYAYFHAQRRCRRTHDQGATLSGMLETLKLDGQPEEAGWPYLNAVPSDLALWVPPLSIGPCFGRVGGMGAVDLAPIITSIAARNPVILLAYLSQAFFRPAADGIVEPGVGEIPDLSLRHAVVAVGHGRVDGQQAILVRNSWGAGWGLEGHAWLTKGFLEPRLFATAILRENVDVSTRSTAA